MSLTIWRISKQEHENSSFSGEGSSKYGGRWNSPGRRVVYTSASLALATLETLVQQGVNRMNIPLICIRAEIPDSVEIESIDLDLLPFDWRHYPSPPSLAAIGDKWFDSGRTAILAVPPATLPVSPVIIPLENNYLLNPLHRDFPQINIYPAQPYEFDQRLQ